MIGLDVGGANTKAAVIDDGGVTRTASQAVEVARRPQDLAAAISSVVTRLGSEPVCLTMTAELADVFESKRAGVLYVLEAVEQALPGRALRVLRTDGELVDMVDARSDPLRCAAANWVATALLLARALPDAILLDCGSTTTDLIPVAGGEIVARGRTDLDRLLEGELVYSGALRTAVPAILSHVPIAGRDCPVAAAAFAIAADAHLLLGNLTREQCDCEFPDGRGSAPAEVRSRLARVVCADPGQLTDQDLLAIAAAVEEAQVSAITAALSRVRDRVPHGTKAVSVGAGAFLANLAAARCGVDVLPATDLPWPASALAGPGGDVAAAVALAVMGSGGSGEF